MKRLEGDFDYIVVGAAGRIVANRLSQKLSCLTPGVQSSALNHVGDQSLGSKRDEPI
jgi:hypothetical protein